LHQKEVALGNIETSFVANTATRTGRAESTIRRDAHRGANISDEAAEKLRGTPLDNGEYIDKLKKVPMKDQVAVFERDLSNIQVEKSAGPKGDLDHINRDPSDNRFCNLREATPKQNGANTRVPASSTSGANGVCWHKLARKWQVSIRVNDKQSV
jgi:hypothetical protein